MWTKFYFSLIFPMVALILRLNGDEMQKYSNLSTWASRWTLNNKLLKKKKNIRENFLAVVGDNIGKSSFSKLMMIVQKISPHLWLLCIDHTYT